MKRWVKSLLTGLIIAAGVLLLLFAFLPALLKPTLNRWLPDMLAGAGMQQGHIEIAGLSWQQLTVTALRLPLADGSLIALQDLQLNYSLSGLLQGRLQTARLQQLTLHLAADSGKKLAGAAAAEARQTATEVLQQTPQIDIPAFTEWLSLPLESLQIEHIDIQHPAIAAHLQADVSPQLWRIWGDTQLDNQPLPWQLEVQLQSSGALLIMLSEARRLLSQLHGQVNQDDQGNTLIQLQQQLDLGALSSRLLPQLAGRLPLSDARLQASIRLPPHLQLPQQLSFDAQLQLNSQAATLIDQPGQQLSWQSGQFQLQLQKNSDQPLQWQLSGQHQLQLQLQQQQLSLSQQASQPLLRGSCDARLQQCDIQGLLPWQLQAGQQQAQLQLTPQLSWHQQQGSEARLAVQLEAQQQDPRWPQLTLSSQGEFRWHSDATGDWQLSSEQGLVSRIISQPYALPGDASLTATAGALQLALLPQLQLNSQAGELSFAPVQLDIQPFELTLQQPDRHSPLAQLQLERSHLSCDPRLFSTGLSADCQLQTGLAPSDYDGWPIPDLQLSSPVNISLITANQQPGTMTVNARPQLTGANQQLTLRSQLHHWQQGNQQRGHWQWHLTDLPLNWSGLGLDQLTELSRIQLLSGALSGQGWLDWQQQQNQPLQLKPDLMLRFDNLSAIYDNSVSLEGWQGLLALRRPLNFDLGDPGDYLIDAQISADSLNAGIQLNNLLGRSQTRLPADLSYALVDIYELHTNLLGGRIHTPRISFDSRKQINAFGIEVDNIQLSQLAALEANADVEASGVLDGVLPIVLTPDGPQVPGGNLFARDPGGVIRYNNSTSAALKSSDQTVGMAMQLLEDFRYDQLESGIEYQADGRLNLALQFQGHNPGFFGGQATHLNVNLEYNLLDLLESLRITNDLIQRVEDKYQR